MTERAPATTGGPSSAESQAAGAGSPVAGVYVYGVIPRPDTREWGRADSVDDALIGVRTVEGGELAALVESLAPGRTPGKREDLERHESVLSQAIELGTVIPMRFGTVMDDDDVVRQELLARHSAELMELLRGLEGHVQMTLKAFYLEDALFRDVVAAHPDFARESAVLAGRPEAEVRGQKIRLGERVAAAATARREEHERMLLDRLSPVVADLRVEPARNEELALNAQLLVHRRRRGDLDELVRELAKTYEARLAFRYLGPLAPYSFSDLSLEGPG